jgi:hypothetical protein
MAERPSKCAHVACKRKLTLLDYACKCGKYYCTGHRYAETHECSYDYKKSYSNELLKHMSTNIIAQKVEHI